MSYRPICDVWFLARAALKPMPDGSPRKYYGAYLGGFPERARALIGANINDPVLHVCGGMARYYKYPQGYGPADRTLDLDPDCDPDFLQDARDPFPKHGWKAGARLIPRGHSPGQPATNSINLFEFDPLDAQSWAGILIDPPYSEVDAEKYKPGAKAYPKPNKLIANAMDVLPIGGKVGLIHYILPAYNKNTMRFTAVAGVMCGFNNRIRAFSVFEKLA